MAAAVPSRFACLKMDDDEDIAPKQKTVQKNKTLKKVKTGAKPSQPQSNGNAASTSSKKKKKPVEANQQQWEQWKKKDSEMVNGNFEDDLEQAIMLSKLEFEKKKETEKNKKVVEKEKPKPIEPAKGAQRKQKQKKTMSLDQFNDLLAGKASDAPDPSVLDDDTEPQEVSEEPPADTTFFHRVTSDTKAELAKNKHHDLFKQRGHISDEDLIKVRCQEVIEKRNAEIETLKQNIQTLKDELGKVRCRNKQLCFILGQSEMREKAELVQELERLRGEQEDSVAEVARLHKELEQERTHHTETKKMNIHKKKNVRFDASTEECIKSSRNVS